MHNKDGTRAQGVNRNEHAPSRAVACLAAAADVSFAVSGESTMALFARRLDDSQKVSCRNDKVAAALQAVAMHLVYKA